MVTVAYNGEELVNTDRSNATVVEGRLYFRQEDLLDATKFVVADTHTTCPWKGKASYYNYKTSDGTTVKDIAWFYPQPKAGAEMVAGRVAFYVGKVPGLTEK